jgi:hypothetical protein
LIFSPFMKTTFWATGSKESAHSPRTQ